MTKRRRGIQDIDLDRAIWPWKPAVGISDEARAHVILYMPVHVQPVAGEKPVDVSRVLGREPVEWEAGLITEARRGERERERRMLA